MKEMTLNWHVVQEKVIVPIVAFILWAVTVVLAFWHIVVVPDVLIQLYGRLVANMPQMSAYWTAVNLQNWVIFLLAVVFIAVVLGGGEYHYRHYGQSRSWKLLAWTIGIQLLILALPLFV
jgi:hypothetical protein